VVGWRWWRCGVFSFALVVVVASVGSTASAEPPQLGAKRAQAAEVLREMSVLDERLGVLSERYDGARVHLQAVGRRLSFERLSLLHARKQYNRAVNQVARLLVSLYTEGSPSSLEAIFGARSFEEMLNVADAQAAVARERSEIVTTARAARQRLHAAVAALQADRADAARSVARLARTRRAAAQAIRQRQRLLASVRVEIAQLQARERLRQQRLLAAARARLAAAAAARAARERADAARAAARARAEAKAAGGRTATQTATAERPPAPTETETETTSTQPPPAASQPQPPSNSTPTATTAPAPLPIDATPTNATPTVSEPVPAAPSPPPAAGHPQAAQIALGYIGIPYRWGGATPAGFDCSGLVSYVYAQLGIQLPHYAAAQFDYGSPVARDQLQPGDLVFFDNLAHVGIYIGADQFVHAPHAGTVVSIDSLDDAWYAGHYVGARRI
jgi:cell wall-associated NlpC family hydrolase